MSTSADLLNLDDDSQLARVALLLSALPVTRAAPKDHPGDWGSTRVPEAESQSVALVRRIQRTLWQGQRGVASFE